MAKMTRRKAQAWLDPMRQTMQQILLTGESHAIKGYASARMHDGKWVRLDWLCAGFRGLLDRLLPDLDCSALLKVERKLAIGVPLERDEVVAVVRMFRMTESSLMKKTVEEVQDAVLTEQIAIEVEAIGLATVAQT